MKSRPLGQTGLVVSEVALGTWGLSGEAYSPVQESEARSVISRALQMGISLIETSSSYGLAQNKTGGEMEAAIGEIITEHAERGGVKASDLTVVTRIGTDRSSDPARKRFDATFVEEATKRARQRLGPDVNLIVLLHNPSRSAIEHGEATSTLEQLAKAGTIESWGVSAGDQAIAEAALDRDAPVLSLPHNIFFVQPLRAIAEKLREKKTGLLVHSVLAYGLLVGRWPQTKVFPIYDHRNHRWPEGSVKKRIQQLDAVRPLVSGEVTSMRSAALRFALQEELVSSVVLGPRIGVHLDQLLRDLQGSGPYLSEAKLSSLEARLSHVGLR